MWGGHNRAIQKKNLGLYLYRPGYTILRRLDVFRALNILAFLIKRLVKQGAPVCARGVLRVRCISLTFRKLTCATSSSREHHRDVSPYPARPPPPPFLRVACFTIHSKAHPSGHRAIRATPNGATRNL